MGRFEGAAITPISRLFVVVPLLLLCSGIETPAKAPRHLFFSGGGIGFAERERTVKTKNSSLGEIANPFSLVTIDVGFWKPLTQRFQIRVYGSFGAGENEGTLHRNFPLYIDDSYEFHDLRDLESHTFFSGAAEAVLMPAGTARMMPYFFAGVGLNRYSVSTSLVVDDSSQYSGQVIGEAEGFSNTSASFLAGWGTLIPATFGGLYIQGKARYWSPIDFVKDSFGYPLHVTERQWNLLIEAGLLF